jgi:hypothetical protein
MKRRHLNLASAESEPSLALRQLAVAALDGVIEGLEEIAAMHGDSVKLSLREIIDLLTACRNESLPGDEPEPQSLRA